MFVSCLWDGLVRYYDFYFSDELELNSTNNIIILRSSYNGVVSFIWCFTPLAGFLADVKFGRYKAVVRSFAIVTISIPIFAIKVVQRLYFGKEGAVQIILCASLFATLILAYVGLIGFAANVIQFGMDQLHDSPGEDRTLFIHWYVWTSFFAMFAGHLTWDIAIPLLTRNETSYFGYGILSLVPISMIILAVVTLCLAKRKKRWFLIEPGAYNPYWLVYRVTKFAYQHKHPVLRSAFTYCEDELPTGLNLAKQKYGGPLSNEQVEDVKVFYGILKALLAFGMLFFLEFAANLVLPNSFNSAPLYDSSETHVFSGAMIIKIALSNSISLILTACIPLYLCLLRPFVLGYTLGMLKRMGLGMIMALLSLASSFVINTSANKMNLVSTTSCSISGYSIESKYFVIPLILLAISSMFSYTAIFEFICSQSPHSMKGLLIGLLYAIRGFYRLLASFLVVFIYIGFKFSHHQFDCGFIYGIVCIIMGVIAVLAFSLVSYRYRYRERDEPFNIYRYAEDYYSSDPEESRSSYGSSIVS